MVDVIDFHARGRVQDGAVHVNGSVSTSHVSASLRVGDSAPEGNTPSVLTEPFVVFRTHDGAVSLRQDNLLTFHVASSSDTPCSQIVPYPEYPDGYARKDHSNRC
jgi:hypothetical protein